MLRVDRLDGVATLTLDRPEVGNALDHALVARLGEALAACAAEPAVRVVVVTGAGRVFSAGADLNWMRRMRDAGPQANLDDARRTQAVFAAIAELPGRWWRASTGRRGAAGWGSWPLPTSWSPR